MDFQQIRKYVKGVLTNSFLNKTTLDKLSTSNEGNLLFDGKELKNIGNVEASITELWSGQQNVSAEITLLDDYSNYDIIVSMIEPLEDYPTQQKFDFMLKGGTSLTGGMCENNNYITQYRLKDWNGTNVYFLRDTSTGGWNITLRKIWGIKFVTQQHEYSTEEQIVGKWIDGKPIYEKVINVENFIIGNNEITLENLDTIINYSGSLIISGDKRVFPFIQNNTSSKVIINDYNNIRIVVNSAFNCNNIYIIIQYTKTTD